MGSANLVEASARESSIRFQAEGALNRDTLTALWVQVWVQLKKEKWLPISRKRHQMGHLDFRSSRLLTEGLFTFTDTPKLRTWARSAFVGSSQQMLSELIYRGFFTPLKPFCTVLDPID